MANNFDSNITRPLARVFTEKFESERILSKNVNTQLLTGRFNPSTGDTVDFKRPTDYVSVRTPKGDVSGETPSDIITGKSSGIVQDYFTAFIDFDEADEAIKMDQLPELIDPLAIRIKTDLELDFGRFMLRNTALLAGTVGTPVSNWDHIAEAGAIMQSSGIPMDDDWLYTVNPHTQRALASDQRSLGAGGVAGKLISEAQRKATIDENFAGMKVMTATTLPSYTTDTEVDRVGTLSADPDVTYVTAKDSMQQTLLVQDFGNDLEIRAGETLRITGVNRLNLSTRQVILDETGTEIVFTGTVVSDVTLSGTGTGSIVITGPALFEATGAFNTASRAAITGDIITLLGSDSTIIQPNLFWHKQAFSIGSVPIKKLHSTDTLSTTVDGLMFRVSKGVGFLENEQKIRIDFRPAYSVLNPFFAGQGFGS